MHEQAARMMCLSSESAKYSLAFILSDDARDVAMAPHHPAAMQVATRLRSRSTSTDSLPVRHSRSSRAASAPSPPRSAKPRRHMTLEEKRRARQCSVDGCTNYTIDRGLCFRHGGGKICSVQGCQTSAKARGLCWRHGGSIGCTIPGCKRGAKSRGLCWSHGGGTRCSVEGCDKTTISKGVCWTHGGGKRCTVDGCKRPAAESRHNLCTKHFIETLSR